MDYSFVEITNPAKVRSETNFINKQDLHGCLVNREEWKRYSFYPKKGVVGAILGVGHCYEGPLYFIQCADNNIVVPILKDGFKYITQDDFYRRYPQNLVVGKTANYELSSFYAAESSDHIDGVMKRMM